MAVSGDVETFTSAIARLAGLVDGKHANGFGDIRALDRRCHLQAKFASRFSPIRTRAICRAFDVLMAKLGGIRVSTRQPCRGLHGPAGAIAVLGAQGQPIVVPVLEGRGTDK